MFCRFPSRYQILHWSLIRRPITDFWLYTQPIRVQALKLISTDYSSYYFLVFSLLHRGTWKITCFHDGQMSAAFLHSDWRFLCSSGISFLSYHLFNPAALREKSMVLHKMWLHFVKIFQWTINFLCNKIPEQIPWGWVFCLFGFFLKIMLIYTV